MKTFKIIGIMSLIVFSFYLTDIASELLINSNPLMQTIKEVEKNYTCKSVNAYINENTIIPGIKGKKINELESYLNMKDFGSFNEYYLAYDEIVPEISLKDNKDKIIISGNKSIRDISILILNNVDVEEYLENNDIKYTKLTNDRLNLSYKEIVNIESNKNKYKDLETILKKKNKSVGICILDYSNIEECKRNNYYIVKPSFILKNNSKYTIENGNIIIIDNNLSLENFKILLNIIRKKDLKIVYLSEIIKE